MRLQAAIPVDQLEGFGARRRRRRRKRRRRRQESPPRDLRRARSARRVSRSEEPALEPAPNRWSPPDAEVIDVEWTEATPEWPPSLQGVSRRGRGRRERRESWGPSVRMGRHLRIRAASGYRAAVIDLKPGLYLVAELPEEVSRTEFGIAPLLAPLMVQAAKRALAKPAEGKTGPLSALFRQHREGGPVKLFQAREARALPGPAPKAALEPDETFLLPAPDVDWADEHDVAGMIGCEPCGRTR